MKKDVKLGLVCKIVAVVYFSVNVLATLGNVVLTFGYGAWADIRMWFTLCLRLLLQAVGALVPSLILWGVGTLLDQQQRDHQELERIVKHLGGEEENGPEGYMENEADTLEGCISVDDLESLDQPTQEC